MYKCIIIIIIIHKYQFVCFLLNIFGEITPHVLQ